MKKLLLILLIFPLYTFGQLPQLGDYFQGGIVFHIDSIENTGLIVLDEEFVGNYKWGCVDYQMPGAFYSSIGKGMANSLEIQVNCLDTIQYNSGGTTELSQNAANACLNFMHLEYDDWFLPSISELQLIYDLYGQSFVTNIGHNFQYSNGYYWSSTQTDNEDSWIVDFYDGDSHGNYGKNNQIEIRPIRQYNLYGCKDELALNIDLLAVYEDNSRCNYSSESYQMLSTESTTAVSSLQAALESWDTTVELQQGWNMFGYGCPESSNSAEVLAEYTDKIIVVKDNNGLVYMPEFGFNGVGDFTTGYGYKIKLLEAIEGFSLCDWYVNDLPEDNIVSLQDSIANLAIEINSLQLEIDDFNSTIQVGDLAYGGIVFYIDNTGEHGLVSYANDIGAYQWGCVGMEIIGAEGQEIGDGNQNSLDIVASCNETPIASSECLSFNGNDYNDWYLPSLGELNLMYTNLKSNSCLTDITVFSNSLYWTSSEYGANGAWCVSFDSGMNTNNLENMVNQVRPIRAF